MSPPDLVCQEEEGTPEYVPDTGIFQLPQLLFDISARLPVAVPLKVLPVPDKLPETENGFKVKPRVEGADSLPAASIALNAREWVPDGRFEVKDVPDTTVYAPPFTL